MVLPDGVEFDALDGEKVNLIFLIAAPDSRDNVHLDVLSKLSVLLMDENFTKGLRSASSVEEFLAVSDAAEELIRKATAGNVSTYRSQSDKEVENTD